MKLRRVATARCSFRVPDVHSDADGSEAIVLEFLDATDPAVQCELLHVSAFILSSNKRACS
jgi:hypothetical protein